MLVQAFALSEYQLISKQKGIPENLAQEAPQRPSSGAQRPPSASAGATTSTGTATSPPAASAPSTTAQTTTDPSEPVNLFEAAAAANRPGAARTPGTGGDSAGTGGGAGSLGAAGATGNLDFLRENPMFQQLRQLVQQQPQMLESVLQQVGNSNPQLAQLISQHPDQFIQLLSEGGDGEGGDIPQPPGANNVVSVTEEERDAIERV